MIIIIRCKITDHTFIWQTCKCSWFDGCWPLPRPPRCIMDRGSEKVWPQASERFVPEPAVHQHYVNNFQLLPVFHDSMETIGSKLETGLQQARVQQALLEHDDSQWWFMCELCFVSFNQDGGNWPCDALLPGCTREQQRSQRDPAASKGHVANHMEHRDICAQSIVNGEGAKGTSGHNHRPRL